MNGYYKTEFGLCGQMKMEWSQTVICAGWPKTQLMQLQPLNCCYYFSVHVPPVQKSELGIHEKRNQPVVYVQLVRDLSIPGLQPVHN
jgi:hypothetical protein